MKTLQRDSRQAVHPLKCLQKENHPGLNWCSDLEKKRRSIEIGYLEAWLTHGKGSFHFENLAALRRLLTLFFRMTGLAGLGAQNTLDIRVNTVRFTFPNLPPAFDGFRILHLSDLHIDGLADLTPTICAKIQDLKYDLCLLTGDFRFEIYGPNHTVDHYMAMLLDTVQAPCGVLGVLGNHDFLETAQDLDRRGVTMLINEAHSIQRGNDRIWIAGLDDPHYYGCDDLAGALSQVPEDAFKILAVHTPELFKEAAEQRINLYLCGHTHGGQICLPFIGPVLLNAHCPRRLSHGVWRQGAMQGYTHVGTGSSMVPVRFNCPPEIALIELKCAE